MSDLVAIAIGCGLSNSVWAADEEDFERLVDQSLTASGPTLIGVRIDDKPVDTGVDSSLWSILRTVVSPQTGSPFRFFEREAGFGFQVTN